MPAGFRLMDDKEENMTMEAIQMTAVVQLHDMVQLLVFRDERTGRCDCRLAAGQYDADKPLKEQANVWAAIQNGETNPEKGENVGVEIEQGLYERVKVWCGNLGITPQQLLFQFARFCGTPENKVVAKRWLADMLAAAPENG